MKAIQLITTLTLLLTATFSAATQISLEKASSRINSKYGFNWQSFSATAVVENLAYAKNVQLYFKDRTGEWATADFAFDGIINHNLQRWSISFQETLTSPYLSQEALDLEFVLRYEVAGQVYWDNNLGQNYHLPASSGEYITAPVVKEYGYAHAPYTYTFSNGSADIAGKFRVTALVQNLGYEKQVEVHYSYDNWQTVHIGALAYQYGKYEGYSWVTYPNANNVEYWTFESQGEEAQAMAAEAVVFAIKYTVNGEVYWDNNHGENYQILVDKRD